MGISLKPKRQRLLRVSVCDGGYSPQDGWRIVEFQACSIAAAGGGSSPFCSDFSSKYAIVLLEEI